MKNILFYCLLALTITMTAQRNQLKNIYSENGKIGIGTNTPDELLTVKGKIHTHRFSPCFLASSRPRRENATHRFSLFFSLRDL